MQPGDLDKSVHSCCLFFVPRSKHYVQAGLIEWHPGVPVTSVMRGCDPSVADEAWAFYDDTNALWKSYVGDFSLGLHDLFDFQLSF
jgi:hypothetical protein